MGNRLNNWLWKLGNKRPPKPYETYASTVGKWFFIGLIWGGMFSVSLAFEQADIQHWFIPIIIAIVCSVLLSWIVIKQHKEEGYYNAISKIGDKYWYDRATKLGMIKPPKKN